MKNDDLTYNTPSCAALYSNSIRLFAYGTLMFPEVWREVVGREVPSREARLAGYEALRVAGHDFPGLVPSVESRWIDGILYDGISEAELQSLDAYESSMYDRIVVEIEDGSQDPPSAYVYLVKEARRGELTDERWDPRRDLDV